MPSVEPVYEDGESSESDFSEETTLEIFDPREELPSQQSEGQRLPARDEAPLCGERRLEAARSLSLVLFEHVQTAQAAREALGALLLPLGEINGTRRGGQALALLGALWTEGAKRRGGAERDKALVLYLLSTEAAQQVAVAVFAFAALRLQRLAVRETRLKRLRCALQEADNFVQCRGESLRAAFAEYAEKVGDTRRLQREERCLQQSAVESVFQMLSSANCETVLQTLLQVPRAAAAANEAADLASKSAERGGLASAWRLAAAGAGLEAKTQREATPPSKIDGPTLAALTGAHGEEAAALAWNSVESLSFATTTAAASSSQPSRVDFCCFSSLGLCSHQALLRRVGLHKRLASKAISLLTNVLNNLYCAPAELQQSPLPETTPQCSLRKAAAAQAASLAAAPAVSAATRWLTLLLTEEFLRELLREGGAAGEAGVGGAAYPEEAEAATTRLAERHFAPLLGTALLRLGSAHAEALSSELDRAADSQSEDSRHSHSQAEPRLVPSVGEGRDKGGDGEEPSLVESLLLGGSGSSESRCASSSQAQRTARLFQECEKKAESHCGPVFSAAALVAAVVAVALRSVSVSVSGFAEIGERCTATEAKRSQRGPASLSGSRNLLLRSPEWTKSAACRLLETLDERRFLRDALSSECWERAVCSAALCVSTQNPEAALPLVRFLAPFCTRQLLQQRLAASAALLGVAAASPVSRRDVLVAVLEAAQGAASSSLSELCSLLAEEAAAVSAKKSAALGSSAVAAAAVDALKTLRLSLETQRRVVAEAFGSCEDEAGESGANCESGNLLIGAAARGGVLQIQQESENRQTLASARLRALALRLLTFRSSAPPCFRRLWRCTYSCAPSKKKWLSLREDDSNRRPWRPSPPRCVSQCKSSSIRLQPAV